jgi:lipoyl(octanoyl) transferase
VLLPAPSAPPDPPAIWKWLGRVSFAETVGRQERLRAAILAGAAPETLLLLEHDPVITLGRSALPANLLVGEEDLRRRGIGVHRASRGGDVTYHGPGQLVGYPVVRLRRGVRAHVEGMAAALTEVLAEHGIAATYRPGTPGLWVRAGATEAKICAFGINVHRRVTIHGFALNVDPDLEAFSLIVPCGLYGCRVTSMRVASGRPAPTPQSLAPRVAAALARHLGLGAEIASAENDDADAPTTAAAIALAAGDTTMVEA